MKNLMLVTLSGLIFASGSVMASNQGHIEYQDKKQQWEELSYEQKQEELSYEQKQEELSYEQKQEVKEKYKNS